jgi:hypothetical protein
MSAGTAADPERSARRLGTAALVWSAGLILAALLWPAYSSSTTTADTVTLGRATLVQVNGARALVLVAIPLVVSAIVLAAIRMRRAGVRFTGAVAWVAIGVLALECLVGILTIGLFIVPVPVLLALATRRGGRPAGDAHRRAVARPDASSNAPGVSP